MRYSSQHKLRATIAAAAACLALVLAGCSSTSSSSDKTSGSTIQVVWTSPAPPQSALDSFKKETGITVKWSQLDWDSIQTKITTSATAGTYYADVSYVDWSRVGQFEQLGWFDKLEDYMNTKALAKDMPQLSSFTSNGHVIGVPYETSFNVTVVNNDLFKKAGITTSPTTMSQYTSDLHQIKDKGVVEYPLDIPFAASEGLSTYWYQATTAFGGEILNKKGEPQFASANSAGRKAAEWMIDSLKSGLVPPGNINATDSVGIDLMAKGQVASIFSDYSGDVGTVYDVPSSSSVTGQVSYLPTPGVDGVAGNVATPAAMGIPSKAKYPKAAAKFIQWMLSSKNQADFAGASGPDKVMASRGIPSRQSSLDEVKGTIAGGDQISAMLKTSVPVFPGGAPVWYPEFSRAVYTNLHSAATGSITADQAVDAIVAKAKELAKG